MRNIGQAAGNGRGPKESGMPLCGLAGIPQELSFAETVRGEIRRNRRPGLAIVGRKLQVDGETRWSRRIDPGDFERVDNRRTRTVDKLQIQAIPLRSGEVKGPLD